MSFILRLNERNANNMLHLNVAFHLQVLGDEEKRSRYDRGEDIEEMGMGGGGGGFTFTFDDGFPGGFGGGFPGGGGGGFGFNF